jgi:lipoprotein-anchoring transpeptidase ErfK/SrfK
MRTTRSLILALLATLAIGACSKATTATPVTDPTSAPTTVAPDQPGTSPTQVPELEAPDPTAKPVVAQSASTNVQAKGDLEVYERPDGKAKVLTTLKAKTGLGSKTTLVVVDQRDGWYQVSLPIRPNGSTGWVKAGNVSPRQNDVSVTVDLGARKLTVFKGSEAAVESPIAIGEADTPTPTGSFYVTDFVQSSNPGGSYGPFAFGLSGHSPTLTEFAGGDGQIGIHGTNDPSSIGQAASHGCVRLPNEVITVLANLVSLGTPVTIV